MPWSATLGTATAAELSLKPIGRLLFRLVRPFVAMLNTTGSGRNPPSLPIWMKAGPGRLIGAMMGLLLGSIPPVFAVVIPSGVLSATYSCRLKKRELAPFNMRKRNLWGGTVTVGYGAPLTRMVSEKYSGTEDG